MNNIMKPELKWIEGRCYRVTDSSAADVSTLVEHDIYDNDVEFQDLEEDDEDEDYQIIMVDPNRYYTNLYISRHYLGLIIGKKGATKMRMQRDTNTDIKIPKPGQNNDIVIYGPTIANVKAARRKINIIVLAAKKKQKCTHFISIPFNTPSIMKNFENFKETVLRDFNCRGLDESCFVKPSKLHVTVAVMCLMDNEERLVASKVLSEAQQKVIMPMVKDHFPLRLRMKGLSYMNDDPENIDVLYSCVEEDNAESGLLQRFVNSVSKFFDKKGLLHGKCFNGDNVKIHVTLINTKYRESTDDEVSEDENAKPNVHNIKIERKPFDGSEILSKLRNYDFGAMELTDIHLSQIGAIGPDGYYQSTCVLPCFNKCE